MCKPENDGEAEDAKFISVSMLTRIFSHLYDLSPATLQKNGYGENEIHGNVAGLFHMIWIMRNFAMSIKQ